MKGGCEIVRVNYIKERIKLNKKKEDKVRQGRYEVVGEKKGKKKSKKGREGKIRIEIKKGKRK